MAEYRKLPPEVEADLARLSYELSQDSPESRKAFGAVVKKFKPDSPHAKAFSDIDIEEKFESFKADQEKKEVEKQQERLMAQLTAQRSKLLSGDGGRKYSEDDVKEIEKLMTKKGISDYDDGAILWAATNPPSNPNPAVPPTHGATWEMPEFARFGKDPVRASREVANEVIGEFLRKRA